MLKPYWESIEKELIIFSPYFVPGKAGAAFLTQLAQKGVRVKILTNSLASNQNGSETLLWHGIKDGKPVVYTHEPYVGFWRRFGIGFMSMWPIESQL